MSLLWEKSIFVFLPVNVNPTQLDQDIRLYLIYISGLLLVKFASSCFSLVEKIENSTPLF
jgi:hypothetical protein